MADSKPIVITTTRRRPNWVRWTVLGLALFIGLTTTVIFMGMQRYEKAQNDPYTRLPMKSFSTYITSSFDRNKQKKILDAVNKLSTFRQNQSDAYTTKQLEKCERDLRDAVDLFRETMGEDNEYLVTAYDQLGECLSSQGKYEEAEGAFANALKVNERACGPENQITCGAMVDLAGAKRKLKKFKEARALLDRNYAIHSKYRDADSLEVAYATERIGECLSDERKYEQAANFYKQALEIHRSNENSTPSEIDRLVEWMGWLELERHNMPEAMKYYNELLANYEKENNYEKLADINYTIATGWFASKNFGQAEAAAKASLASAKQLSTKSVRDSMTKRAQVYLDVISVARTAR